MKNKTNWNNYAAKYTARVHSEKEMNALIRDPAGAFHKTTWGMIKMYLPDLEGKKICVPSSGDNHAVFAFAMLGAKVTSCDFAENQLANAERIAKEYGWAGSIEFICADTMALDGVQSNAFDFVYTSNGVHVWISGLPAMYHSIHRILKPGGIYTMFEIHPYQRPFDEALKVVKPYDATGPIESETMINYHWRVMDIANAILGSGLTALHIEEMFAEKNYDWPFWQSMADYMAGITVPREEVDRMHDWQHNPPAALPTWLGIAAQKG
ncbi:MAG: class I SAM-dependent methyltransferase [Defluviitaleaceae bacterium]|nr:class I SAM-dependent methyltransferase [Defluviitaleaceae bacterium]